MDRERGQRIYRTVMLIIITALITAIVTTIFVYKKVAPIKSIEEIAKDSGTSGLELTLASIRSMLEEEYIGELDDEQMVEAAIKGYVAGVGDKYTEYYTPEEMSSQMDEALGNYLGIGIYMLADAENGTITVVKPMDNSPAKEAGLEEGDLITKVEGEEVTVDNVSEISDKIKGQPGTKVKLEIKRGEQTFEVEVERRKIVVSHIESKMLQNNIAYIQITDFEGGTAKEFETKYKELEKQGAKSLIIDIRGNGGGVVDEAIDILELLCNKGDKLLITKNKAGEEVVTTSEKEQSIKVETVVLMDGYSASASEILAGALKDNNRAQIVGTKSYGKGVIQTLHQLSDGSGIKITSEEYYTPNNTKINKVGIEPNVEVKLPDDIEELTEENDTQLKKAIELLQNNES